MLNGRPFELSLMFVRKARSLLESGAPCFRKYAGNACQGQTIVNYGRIFYIKNWALMI